MRYKDEQHINELENMFKRLMIWLTVLFVIISTLTILTVKGCSNTVAPVHFKESYTPTKFNKL
jgi:preprotein translocase subunit SecG